MEGLVSRRFFDQAGAGRSGGRPRPATSRSASNLPRRPAPQPAPKPAARAAVPGLSGNPERVLLKPDQAARLLGIAPATMRNWRYQGRGPKFLKIGTAVRYRLSDLDKFAAASLRRSTSDPGPARGASPSDADADDRPPAA